MGKTILHGALLFALLFALSGCILVGKGNTTSQLKPTVGQELIDLKAAFDRKSITKEEYEKAKAAMLESVEKNKPSGK